MAAALIAPRHHPFPALVGAPPHEVGPADVRVARAAVYRRRRIAAALVALVVVWLAFTVATAAASLVSTAVTTVTAGEPGAAGVSTQVHTVQPGDSLWTIARSIRPEGDVRPIVDELAQRTGGAPLQPGQRIDVDGLG